LPFEFYIKHTTTLPKKAVALLRKDNDHQANRRIP
jgi:hypothetical protein